MLFATPIFPFSNPDIMRKLSAIQYDVEKPNTTIANPLPKTPNNNTGFLPTLFMVLFN